MAHSIQVQILIWIMDTLSTVERLFLSQRLLMYNGHIGGRSFVHCREVVSLSEVANVPCSHSWSGAICPFYRGCVHFSECPLPEATTTTLRTYQNNLISLLQCVSLSSLLSPALPLPFPNLLPPLRDAPPPPPQLPPPKPPVPEFGAGGGGGGERELFQVVHHGVMETGRHTLLHYWCVRCTLRQKNEQNITKKDYQLE